MNKFAAFVMFILAPALFLFSNLVIGKTSPAILAFFGGSQLLALSSFLVVYYVLMILVVWLTSLGPKP